MEVYTVTIVPILGAIIAIGAVTFLVFSYGRWCNRYFSSLEEPETIIDVGSDVLSLSKAGTMQLRTIAKTLHVKYYSRLKRDELILAIIAKKEELWNTQQQDLWPDETEE